VAITQPFCAQSGQNFAPERARLASWAFLFLLSEPHSEQNFAPAKVARIDAGHLRNLHLRAAVGTEFCSGLFGFAQLGQGIVAAAAPRLLTPQPAAKDVCHLSADSKARADPAPSGTPPVCRHRQASAPELLDFCASPRSPSTHAC